ncbi:MAG: undecaprenyl-diphosphate phosphatase [Bacteroidales bacterium]
MTLFDVIVLGLVEGITEFLPISSTGHMVLTTTLLHVPETDFVKTFIIVIQLGAILAAAALYWRRLLLDPRTLTITMLAFVPTGLIGFVVYRAIKSFLGNPAIVVASLLVGGALLVAIEWWLKGRDAPLDGPGGQLDDSGALRGRSGGRAVRTIEVHQVSDITYGQAIVIGTCQALSMIPGVSRSAATIMTGLLLGIDRKAIVEFSFILAIPTMAVASAYEIYKSHAAMSFEQVDQLAIGFGVAFVLALVAIKWLLRFVQTHSFNAFGVYRIIAAILFWLVVLR